MNSKFIANRKIALTFFLFRWQFQKNGVINVIQIHGQELLAMMIMINHIKPRVKQISFTPFKNLKNRGI